MSRIKFNIFYGIKRSVFFRQSASICKFSGDSSWVILSDIEQRIKAKIEAIGTPLKDWDINIYRGILTGYNEAFIIDGNKRAELISEDPKSVEIIRPILRGRDIKRYRYEENNLWLIFIPWHFPLHKDTTIKGASTEAEKEFQKQYPAIYNHLLQYKNELSNRNKAETGVRYEWYALQRWGANYWEDFYRPKIVWKRVGSILRFSYDETACFALDSTCFATGQHLKYLVFILNSTLGKYLLKDAPQTGTGDLLISVQAMEPLLLPIPTPLEIEIFNNLFDTLAMSTDNDISNIEKQIDALIYKKIGMSKEEIEFISAR